MQTRPGSKARRLAGPDILHRDTGSKSGVCRFGLGLQSLFPVSPTLAEPQARMRYPGLVLVEIAVSEPVLRERLLARGRETAEQVEQRLQRNRNLSSVAHEAQVINNEGTLGSAGQALVARYAGTPNAYGPSPYQRNA